MERLEIFKFNHKKIDEKTFEEIIQSGYIEHVDSQTVTIGYKHYVQWTFIIGAGVEVLIPYEYETFESPKTREEKIAVRQYNYKNSRELREKTDKINEKLKEYKCAIEKSKTTINKCDENVNSLSSNVKDEEQTLDDGLEL